MNFFKTAVLLTALTLLLIFVGSLIGGRKGMVIAFGFALMINLGSYWWSDKIVLAMYKARPVSEREAPGLFRIIHRLAARGNLPMPRAYLIPTQVPNAFATGRNPHNAAVAVTEGAMELLNEKELEGVLAHELSHIGNRDILIATIAATIAGAVTMLAYWARFAAIFGGFGRNDDEGGGFIGLLVMAIVAPIAALFIQLAISRNREYAADRRGAKLAGSPHGLASALEKLDAYAKRRPVAVSPSTAHLFIVNPLRAGFVASLFSTHPATEKRVERLRTMEVV